MCGNTARTDLYGGYSARSIPTVTVAALTRHPWRFDPTPCDFKKPIRRLCSEGGEGYRYFFVIAFYIGGA